MPRKPPAPTTSTPANNAYMQHSSYHAHGSHLSYLKLAGAAHKTIAARLHKANDGPRTYASRREDGDRYPLGQPALPRVKKNRANISLIVMIDHDRCMILMFDGPVVKIRAGNPILNTARGARMALPPCLNELREQHMAGDVAGLATQQPEWTHRPCTHLLMRRASAPPP